MDSVIGFYGNGEAVTEEVPWLMFTADHVPHWAVQWPGHFPGEQVPEGAAFLSNEPPTEKEKTYALTLTKAI